MKTLILGMAVALSSLTAQADIILIGDVIDAGGITYGGTGCAQGSADAYLDNETGQAFIAFDDYRPGVLAPSQKIGRENCAVVVPVRVPHGKRVVIEDSFLTGYVRLKKNATAQANLETFIAGSTGPKSARNFTGSVAGRFTLRQPGELAASGCGQDVNLRLNSSAYVLAKTSSGESALRVYNLGFHVRIEDCF